MQLIVTLLEVPKAWNELHRRLISAVPDGPVVLAGGCFRDLAFDKHVKDLDFWVEHTDANVEAVKKLFETWPHTGAWSMGKVSVMAGVSDDIHTSIPFSPVRAPLFPNHSKVREANVIFMKKKPTLVSVLKRFDFGICQFGSLDGTAVWSTLDAAKDGWNHTFTYLPRPDLMREIRSRKRWRRLSNSKYYGWKLVGLDPRGPTSTSRISDRSLKAYAKHHKIKHWTKLKSHGASAGGVSC